MKRINLILVIVLISLAFAPVGIVRADPPTPAISASTQATPTGLTAAVEAALGADPPTELTGDYMITNVTTIGINDYYVSVAAIERDALGRWQFDEPDMGKTHWVGALHVVDNGGGLEAEYLALSQPQNMKRATPRRNAGGGSYLYFPWDKGKSMMYGVLGVHGEGEYGLSGGVYVDFLGGDGLGSNIASDVVYAVDEATITWVCDDGQTVAVMTNNTNTGDTFVYAHLLDNANLVEQHSFMQSEAMGNLKHGSFVGYPTYACGGADQQPTNYHVHFGMVPSGGLYQIENCVLTVSTELWNCGGNTIAPQQYITGGGGAGGGVPGARGLSFFDFILNGFGAILDVTIIRLLPEHNDVYQIPLILFNAFKLGIYTIWVLAWGNLDMLVISAVLITILILEALRMLIILIISIAKLIAAAVAFFK